MITDETLKLMDLAEKKHWGFRYVGEGEMPTETFRVANWEFSPLYDYSTTPPQVQRRIEALFNTTNVRGLVIAHDHFVTPRALLSGVQPKLLPPPPKPEPVRVPKPEPAVEVEMDVNFGNPVVEIITGLLKVVFFLPVALVSTVAWMGASLLLMDPVVFAVLEDGSVIEVARWYE